VKAQIGFEQVFSLSLFVFSVTYLIYQLLSYYPSYIGEMRRESIFSEAYQISEILVNDYGDPPNWHSLPLDQIKRIGFLNESIGKSNVLSLIKISKANEICNSNNLNYQKFKQLLDLKNDISFIVYLNNNVVASCVHPFGERVVKVNRIVAFDNGSYGELVIWLY
jgi:hypothetical protein